ncbi:hemolysin XhlA family protein [Priestia aryabhattai]|uniref:hemolysin XhlA family protein n=1 Tax=Priestia aryabhattai TaxID=412384 RepID=UPI003D2D115E
MSQTTEELTMDNINKEIAEIKGKLDTYNTRLYQVERASDKHEQQIGVINKQLSKIEDNTTWIKRAITNAIISGVITGTIGLCTAAFWFIVKGV